MDLLFRRDVHWLGGVREKKGIENDHHREVDRFRDPVSLKDRIEDLLVFSQ